MIIDLGQFIRQGQVRWRELETFLDRFDAEPQLRLSLEEVKRFHYLYERTSADLVRIGTFSADAETGHHLEVLVARAYGQIHDNRRDRRGSLSAKWFFTAFPRAVRKHTLALCLSLALCFAGMAFGGIALLVDLDAKAVIMPWPHLLGDPSDRVAKEESSTRRLASEKTAFSTMLMTHNTKVSIFALAGGMSFGVVTAVLDFYNGVILGAVCVDYIRAGESVFLAGWLLPHGSIEIPAILIAVQAGFVLGFAMIGTPRGRHSLSQRLQAIRGDLVTLIVGVAIMLIWAGLIEAFLSQHHKPVIPYAVKITFGVTQLALLALFLLRSGRAPA